MSHKQSVPKPDNLINPPPPPAPPQRRGPVFPEDMGYIKITTDVPPENSFYLHIREEDTQIGRLRAELLEVCEEMHRRHDLHMKTVRHVRVLKREITRLITRLKCTKGDLAKSINRERELGYSIPLNLEVAANPMEVTQCDESCSQPRR